MTAQSNLYSEGTVARRDVAGEPSQVYDMSDAAAWIVKQVEQKVRSPSSASIMISSGYTSMPPDCQRFAWQP